MENVCSCCGKEIEFLSIDLTNGCLCGECYEKVKACNCRITRRNIGMYSTEEIMDIINAVKKPATVENTPQESPLSNAVPEKNIEPQVPIECQTSAESGNVAETKNSPFGIIKTIGWTVVIIVLIICVINPTFLEEIAMKVINKSGSVYIEMVQTLKPFNNTTYYEAFEGEFDNNEWSYFKSNEKHIVQVVSSYNDIDEEMITQFLLTPQGDDQFYIEPYAVNVAGRNLNTLEKTMVISRLFEGDLSEAIFEALLYGN